MISKEERKAIVAGCQIKPDYGEQAAGGQHTNGPTRGVILTHPDYSITIHMGEYRSIQENRAAAEAMFEFFLLSKNIK
jgi:protein subunit release factor A